MHVYETEGNICQMNGLILTSLILFGLRGYILKGEKGLWFYFESMEFLNGVNKIIDSKYGRFEFWVAFSFPS